ncbi:MULTISPECIES: MBL fold metallo-hydrolase [Marivita]|uniref:MBL fold metallo-hydrolase n=1 Tax=Marivita cryptomonadis TaxID=505252 RepID=A0A9Q2NRC7_9RHOB|nr:MULTISPECIES: MBL fold metallo-hydrolase [Marivita]MCR9166676.1 MBL fold metallo-hydrolase [Paracoccaceae bacterium]MBM2321282.1 MBL fold metallo-hydrolase [Marivita cryptomonadis]MBM2330863.1 MBL fold metallo-hydrolase [Marivita cryptomonadis]MBM2340449.1 MBL fold metallo-hydrolase [Marivita cryptomonadis]MBM2345111.1 MBL fold metallo-hydrolase [Marivita cryptomonadis]
MRFKSLWMALAIAITGSAAFAQDTRRPSHCLAIADATPGMAYIQKASWTAPVEQYSVRINYVAHATFLLQTPGGLNVATDFTGFLGNTALLPDVVTMNHAHDTHWTANPDPAIPHVLPGWGPFGEGIDHHVDLGEMLVRNVSTDIRSQFGGQEDNGNSIFIFEVEGLCIGHLGHLHHEPNDEQYAAIGRLDVVMVPVDGGYTLPREMMVRIVDRLRSSVVIPMHWFSGFALEAFLEEVQDSFVIDRRDSSFLEVSLRDLPSRPTVVVLRPEWLRDAQN